MALAGLHRQGPRVPALVLRWSRVRELQPHHRCRRRGDRRRDLAARPAGANGLLAGRGRPTPPRQLARRHGRRAPAHGRQGPLAPQGAGEGRVVADRGRRGGVLRHDRGPSLRRMVEVGTRQVGIQRLGTDQSRARSSSKPCLHLNVRRLDLLRAEGQRTRALHDVRLRNALQMESFYATPSSDGRRLFTISRAGRAVAVSAFTARSSGRGKSPTSSRTRRRSWPKGWCS